mmetsp:Transcript_367/g.1236  ORF Transcript_367/g.1236 Transcript_367/m.1236 type:complete len:123 (-) Transcript_367:1237-1605(-)
MPWGRQRQQAPPRASDSGLTQALRNLPPAVKFVISVIVDVVGVITYLLPFIGEVLDAPWAPVSAAIIYALYGNTFFAVVGFCEEIFPGTDFIPTACIAWAYDYYRGASRRVPRGRADENVRY